MTLASKFKVFTSSSKLDGAIFRTVRSEYVAQNSCSDDCVHLSCDDSCRAPYFPFTWQCLAAIDRQRLLYSGGLLNIHIEPIEMNNGSGEWWIYGQDYRYYYYAGDGVGKHRYRFIHGSKANECRGFVVTDFSTWCDLSTMTYGSAQQGRC
jgi:hypothetical protein